MPRPCPHCKAWLATDGEAACPKCRGALTDADESEEEDEADGSGSPLDGLARVAFGIPLLFVGAAVLVVGAGFGFALANAIGRKDATGTVLSAVAVLGSVAGLYAVGKSFVSNARRP